MDETVPANPLCGTGAIVISIRPSAASCSVQRSADRLGRCKISSKRRLSEQSRRFSLERAWRALADPVLNRSDEFAGLIRIGHAANHGEEHQPRPPK
jgi:hypothetical protein